MLIYLLPRLLRWLPALLGLTALLAAGVLYWLSRPPAEPPPVVEERIGAAILLKAEQVGKLEVIRLHFSDVLEYKQTNPFPVADAKLLLAVHGEAAGCIDLLKLSADAVREQGDTVFIRLPPPELCYHKINHKQSKVYDLSVTRLFDKTELVQQAFKMAENQVERMALASGILEQTEKHARLVVGEILSGLTRKTIIIETTPAPVVVPSQ